MDDGSQERRWFWATLILSSISIIAFVFAFFELVENRFFRDLNYVSLHYLYISRGIASSLLLALWAAYFVLRQRRVAENELRRSRERYRGILEASPEAVVLFDSELRVAEWNATAERLYGFAREEVLGRELPCVDEARRAELREFMRDVAVGGTVLDRETRRLARDGSLLDVQISVLPFREAAREFFLEVAADIRERVRLRETLIEFEKLTTMGKMAAGTAHHLNTPLASMLLRVQMMREKAAGNSDLAQLEGTIGFCQQFVRRLLEFSRRPAPQKQREEVGGIIAAVLGFLSPSLQAKHVHVSCDTAAADGVRVLADRNQLETLLLILLSNALDAMGENGAIDITAREMDNGVLEISIADSGCGISEADLARVFEPFFTTKPPGKGTGLGLAIARNIVTEHGGAIRLLPNERRGTRAVIELPVVQAAVAQEVV